MNAILLYAVLAGTGEPAPAFGPMLALENPGAGGRAAVFTDAIELALARGTFAAPAAGDTVRAGQRTLAWRSIEPGDGGEYSDPALTGGYAYAEVESDSERVVLLAAKGHKHVVVAGTPRVGDLYGLGFVRVPVALRKGTTPFLFRGGRGGFRARLELPPAPAFLERNDATLPDFVAGAGAPVLAGIVVTNAAMEPLTGLRVVATVPSGASASADLPPLPPCSLRKCAVEFPAPGEVAADGERTVAVRCALVDRAGAVLHEQSFEVRVQPPQGRQRRTFVSAIDGSVQYWSLVPARADSGPAEKGLILSLHGASVEAAGQAGCYAPKDFAHVVCPTNRRPFGFDWEDWGRLDALEVLERAARELETDPRATWLTGHSMGGHGTWLLGALYPDRFAAIAPSAGWPDFFAYGGMRDWPEPTPMQALLMRAANASRSALIERNWALPGIYVLHGDADDNVPVDLARGMRARLGAFHRDFAYREQPGAGHWWGDACVDWPPLLGFLQEHRLPAPGQRTEVDFTTVQPAIASRCGFAEIQAQQQDLLPSRVAARFDVGAARLTATTENVARACFDLAAFLAGGGADGEIALELDDSRLAVARALAEAGPVYCARGASGAWSVAERPAPTLKGPHRAGPLKEAFRNRMVFVYGTGGSPEDAAAARDKARFDAETFWYRGNGSVDVVADGEFDAAAAVDRNVILYGNADVNSAFPALLDGAPIDVRAGSVRVGDRVFEGADLAALFCYPRRGSDVALVGVIAGTGAPGMRSVFQTPLFVSGAGFPDWLVLGLDALELGTAGVRAGGWFGPDWSLAAGSATYASD